jgi:phage terminase large subunit-like protein
MAEMATVVTPAGMATDRMVPFPRQAEFLALDCEEALYGGAAGGGKSEALLMWLAEGIHIPGYSGLIFRRTYPQLAKSNEGLIAKSMRVYKPLGGKWNGTEHQWRFPSGAMIEMGHLQHEKSIDDYTGPSYHRICFDEASQFTESQYTFMFSRIRRTRNYPISLGMRAATNPGGIGHIWLKNRFMTPDFLAKLKGLRPADPSPTGLIFWMNQKRAFVPARLADNPALDFEDYVSKLMHLAPITRERMLNGDWSITEEGAVKAEWFRNFEMQGDYYRCFAADDHMQKNGVFHKADCQRFSIGDCASTSEEQARRKSGKPPSKSCITTWDFHRETGRLLLADCRRGEWDFPTLCYQAREVFEKFNPDWMGFEDASAGRQVLQLLRNLPLRAISHDGKGKLERFARAQNELEQGKVYFGRFDSWTEECQAELMSYTGHPDEPFDFGDTLAYAALHADRTGSTEMLLSAGGIMLGRL